MSRIWWKLKLRWGRGGVEVMEGQEEREGVGLKGVGDL